MLKSARYTPFVGLTAVIAVLVALAFLYRQIAIASLVETEERSNVALTQVFANSVWPHHAEFVINASRIPAHELPDRAEIARLSQELKLLMQGVDVVKVKIYDLNGLTIFSTDARQIGEDKWSNLGFQRAAGGTPVSEIIFREHFDGWEREVSDRNIIGTYVPLRSSEAAPVEAVMEVYADVTGLVSKLEQTQRDIAIGVVGVSSALYLFILWLARRTARLARERDAERAENEKRIRHQAYHDSLTGLPNRVSFSEQLEEAIRRARGAERSCAVMVLDLDRFKLVNDSLGHDRGDQLLQIAANRIQACIRDRDLLFRIGGDEFAVLLEELQGAEEVATIAARTVEAIAEPIHLAQHELTTAVSIGIAIYPRDDKTGARLVKSAEDAMYRAKESGRNRYAFFTPEMGGGAEGELRLQAGLKRALKNNEFVLHYQPRLCAVTQRVVGVEALLRWNHPEWGTVPPARFLPQLEESGLIVPVGAWVLRTACRQNKAWQEMGLPPMRISVNISSRQFRSEALIETVCAALAECRLAPEYLEIELTESLLIENTERASAIVEGLQAMGLTVSIDDFGAGYSSLDYLKRFPIGCLKIDRSFVRDIARSAKDAAIVETIATLAASLKIDLVAEGVEGVEQVNFLRARQCTELQGDYFSPPVPADAVPQLVERFARSLVGLPAAA